jgi:hypothetical protein
MMSLTKSHLFLGLPIHKELKGSLTSSSLFNLFVKEGENYLQEYSEKNFYYLGRILDEKIDLTQLEMLQANIYSLLKKILPDYPFEEIHLQLFPVKSHE